MNLLRSAAFASLLAFLTFPAPAQQGFRVLKAEYGADNRWTDVTERVQNLVRGDGLELRVDGDTLTDPLPGVQKTLRIRYVYQGRTRTDNFQDLASVRLGDPGRRGPSDGNRGNNTIFGGNRGGFGRQQVSITRAEYGVGNRWLDVTNLLNQAMQSGSLRMDVNNQTMGGDPAPANVKTLRVQYVLNGQQRNVTIAENAQLVLPEDGSGNNSGVFNGNTNNNGVSNASGLQILDAYYGAQGRRNNVTSLLSNQLRNDRLNLRVNNQNLGGDPYPGPDKQLYVRYAYRGREYESYTNEGLFVNLPNESDRVVNGNQGANNGIFGGYNNSGLIIESATWGSGNRTIDVTRDLQNRVQGNRLSLRADNGSFNNDPAVGADKELVVRYRNANGNSQTVRVREGNTLNIP